MPRISDSDKLELLRYLETGLPLPDKFRFLLFEEKQEFGLVWNGKSDVVCEAVIPFQTLEQINAPCKNEFPNQEGSPRKFGVQPEKWANKLIWGDNKLILSSLKNGPLREEIERQCGIRLIYIDPPFAVGADFSMEIPVGDNPAANMAAFKEIACRDSWGKGADSFMNMIYERLRLMHDLLADDGSIYVH